MSRFDSLGGSGILPKGDQDNKVLQHRIRYLLFTIDESLAAVDCSVLSVSRKRLDGSPAFI